MLNQYMVMDIAAEQIRDEMRGAEARHLLRRAGIGQPGWLRVQIDKVKCRMGSVLVDLGGRMMCRESQSQAAFSTYA